MSSRGVKETGSKISPQSRLKIDLSSKAVKGNQRGTVSAIRRASLPAIVREKNTLLQRRRVDLERKTQKDTKGDLTSG